MFKLIDNKVVYEIDYDSGYNIECSRCKRTGGIYPGQIHPTSGHLNSDNTVACLNCGNPIFINKFSYFMKGKSYNCECGVILFIGTGCWIKIDKNIPYKGWWNAPALYWK